MDGHPNGGLAMFEMAQGAMQPLLRSLRLVNTAADLAFYDVGLLGLRLFTRGFALSIDMEEEGATGNVAALRTIATHIVNLSAMTDPEGVILVVDAQHAPFIERHADLRAFLDHGLEFPSDAAAVAPEALRRKVRTISISGVGSSALGSAAFAWNVSEALGEPVAAIVPGYGLADIVPQALGGWFGFGLHDFLRELGQRALQSAAPPLALIGRRLACSAPSGAARLHEEPIAFRRGSPESDVLHDILEAAPQIVRLYGHSKGALCIENAIRSLPRERTSGLEVTTFGCVIKEECDADFDQVLGRWDGLGRLNSWGNWPERWIEAWHSTNTLLPLAMPVSRLTKEGPAAAIPDAAPPEPPALPPAAPQALLEDQTRAPKPPRRARPAKPRSRPSE